MKLEECEIHDSEAPKEVKNTQTDTKKYVFLKNHVKELNIRTEEFPSISEATETMILSRKQARRLKKLKQKECNTSIESNKSKKRGEKEEPKQSYNSEVSHNLPSDLNTINPSDIEELRSMYKKCKEILMKIETKYGHLIDLDSNDYITERKRSRMENTDDDCQCAVNKKILFDDDGKQLETETDKSAHICPSKLKYNSSEVCSNSNKNIQIQYEEEKLLPHDLRELSALLRDESIELTFRNEIINKMKAIKQAHLNELKFEKPGLIEKLKQGSQDVFEFKGSNLFSLPGYPK